MQQHRPTLALMLRIGSALIFSIMFLMVKVAAERGISVPEILFWRQAFAAPILFVWLAAQGELRRLRTRRMGSHLMRAVVGTSNMAILFTATSLLPLAEMTTLGFTTPMFAVLIAAMVLREPVGPWRWAAVSLGFIGVLVIARPGGENLHPLGTTLALVSSLVVAIINYQIRDLGRTEEPIRIVFWFGVFGGAISALAMPFFYTGYDLVGWLLMAGLGISGLIGQILLTGSLRYGSVSSVIVMDYTSLIWAALLGWLVWNHVPSDETWIGAPLIVGAGLVIAWREHRLSRRASPISPMEGD